MKKNEICPLSGISGFSCIKHNWNRPEKIQLFLVQYLQNFQASLSG
jgi:hypothetical protein